MSLTVMISVQFVITVLSLVFNTLGIYCLRKRRGGNKNQLILLQNLACIEITKTLYDYIPLALYHFQKDWYSKNHTYFEIVEVNLLSILFCSYIFITLDRLLCVVLDVRYKTIVTRQRVHNALTASWIIGLTPGPASWMMWSHIEHSKVYYYITVDVLISVLICCTYATIITVVHGRKKRLGAGKGGRLGTSVKLPTIPFLLMGSFLFFNFVPDFIFIFHQDDRTFHLISLLWTTGYLADPLLYIFPAKEMRSIAKCVIRGKLPMSRQNTTRITFHARQHLDLEENCMYKQRVSAAISTVNLSLGVAMNVNDQTVSIAILPS